MTRARDESAVVLTHDLDFATTLAVTRADGPSVIQIRAQDVTPEGIGPLVRAALEQFGGALAAGAVVVVDPARLRARVLPIKPS